MADENHNMWSWLLLSLSWFPKYWPLALFLSSQGLALWFLSIPHPSSGLVFGVACITSMICHYTFGRQTGKRVIIYALILNAGLLVLRMNYGELNHTLCLSTVSGSSSDHFNNATPSLEYHPFQSYTRCIVWQLNSAHAFGIKVSYAYHPFCITPRDVLAAQQPSQEIITLLKKLGLNATLVENVNHWLNAMPDGVFVGG